MKNCYPIQSGHHLLFRAFFIGAALCVLMLMLSFGVSAYEINGTATGNILNNGYAAETDGFSVYADTENGYALTLEKDGKTTVIDEHNAQFLNICGEKVYYTYINGYDRETELRCYDVPAGKSTVLWTVPMEEGMKNLLVVGGTALLITNGQVTSFDLETKKATALWGEAIREFIPVEGGTVYTVNGDGALYFRAENGDVTTLASEALSFDCSEDTVYYSNGTDGVYTVSFDGNGKKRVAGGGTNLVYSNDLYWQDGETFYSLSGGKEAASDNAEGAVFSVLSSEVTVAEEDVVTLAEVETASSASLSGLPESPIADDYKEWKQWDPRWNNYPMGTSTIGKSGCLVTAISILLVGSGAEKDNYLAGQFNPSVFVAALTANGGFSGASLVWGAVTKVEPTFKVYTDTKNSNSSFKGLSNTAKATAIANHLAAGRLIVIEVYNPSTGNTHWVAVDYVQNGNVYVCDPGYSSKTGNLFTDYSTVNRAVIFTYSGIRWNGENNGTYVPPVEWDNPFTDVKKTEWYYSDIGEVYEAGLMVGRTNTTFAPEEKMTRAEFVCVIGRLVETDFDEYIGQVEFKDVSSENKSQEWFSKYVYWAAANDVMVGSDGKFRPQDLITREEICCVLIRLADYLNFTLEETETKVTFADSKNISPWAKAQVEKAQVAGLMFGSSDGGKLYAYPKNNAKRAEVAAMVLRFVGKMPIL
ncbi:MAG: S-layer homology domain-containing protein [Clostridia bacterium]